MLGRHYQHRVRPPSDPSHRHLRRQQSLLAKTANNPINNDNQRHWLNPTAASIKDDHCRQRPPMMPSMTSTGAVGSTHCHLRRRWLLSTKTTNAARHHQQQQLAPMASSHRLLHRGQPSSTKTGLLSAITAAAGQGHCHQHHVDGALDFPF